MTETDSLTMGFDLAEIATALEERPVAIPVRGDPRRRGILGPASDVVVARR